MSISSDFLFALQELNWISRRR